MTAGKITYDWMYVSLARAQVDLALNRGAAAIEQAKAVRSRIQTTGTGTWFKRWEAQAALIEGKGLLLTQRAPEALPLLERAVELGAEVYDRERSPLLADSQVALGKCLLALRRRDRARALAAQAKKIHATHTDLGEQFRKPLHELEEQLRARN